MVLILTQWCRLWLGCKFLCSMSSKDTQRFAFIKRNIIWELTYKVEYYISQINGGLIRFLEIWEQDFLKLLVGLIVNNMQRINAKKEHDHHCAVFRVLR